LKTIRDVAAAAKVSTATVSRVLNKSGKVNPVLEKRVLLVAEKLHYRVNLTGRNLRTKSTQILALIVPDVENPFFTAVCRGVEDVANRAGYSVMLCNSDEDSVKEADYISMLVSHNVSGVIISPTSSKLTDVSSLVRRGIRVVALDRKLPLKTDYVRVDNRAAAALATQHLISSGATRVACINGDRSKSTAKERLAGYLDALKEAGLVADPKLQFFVDFKEEGGFEATLEILKMKNRPDAIFVTNNQMMTGVFHALREHNVAMPEQISLVGFDDLPWVDIVTPTVTTVRQPTYEMGMAATYKLLSRFNGDNSEPQEIVFEPELVMRNSSVKLNAAKLSQKIKS
jgi:LacI family transcriptional regulator